MSNTPLDIADDNRNNCPVTLNYITRTKNMHFLVLIHKTNYLFYTKVCRFFFSHIYLHIYSQSF
jgi:hypothetical protein